MKNTLISVVVVVAIIVGGFLVFKNRGVAPIEVNVENSMPVVESDTTEGDTAVANTIEKVVVKEFSVDATTFKFTPATMEVNQGETVKITVKNSKGTHDLKIDEFAVATKLLNAGESDTITFVADKAGVFEYYCSVGSHRAMGMVGKLTVR